MSCLAVPHIGLGDIGISLPSITLPTLQVGVTLCCTLQLPPINPYIVNQLIATAIALIPGLGKVLQPILALLMKAINIINIALDLITFDCPLD